MRYRYEGKHKSKHQGEPDAEWQEIDEDLLGSLGELILGSH